MGGRRQAGPTRWVPARTTPWSPSTPISSATGTFQHSLGAKEEGIQGGSGPLLPNTYSLQLNTNTFTTPECSGTPNKYGSSGSDPKACKGWEQFIYSSTKNEVFIESWLIYWDGPGTCPPSLEPWTPVSGGNRVRGSAPTPAPCPAARRRPKHWNTSSSPVPAMRVRMKSSIATPAHATAVSTPDGPLDLAGECRAARSVGRVRRLLQHAGGIQLGYEPEGRNGTESRRSGGADVRDRRTHGRDEQPVSRPARDHVQRTIGSRSDVPRRTELRRAATPAESCGASYNGHLAETKTLISGASNSLCVDPTEAQFAPTIGSKPNYAGDSTSHSGPFPDTGSACAEFFPEEPTRRTPTNAVPTPDEYYPEFAPGAPWVGQENEGCPGPHGSCNAQGNAAQAWEPRYYIYDETVTLCENQVAGAMLSGRFEADNEAGAFINGTSLATNGNAEGRAGLFGGNEYGPTVSFSSRNLKAGVNVLQFVVINENGPTGLEFYATVTTTQPCEEPKEEPTDNAHWLSNGEPIPPGQVETVKTSGALTFRVNAEVSITCKLKDAETIVNPVGGGNGTDEITTFALTGCKAKPSPCPRGTKLEVVGGGLPWKTELATGPPIVDKILGMEIKIQCSGTVLASYKGSLAPTLGASVLEFGGGELQGAGGGLGVSGTDTLKGPKGDEVIGGKEVPAGSAGPYWYSNGKLIPEGQEEPVATSGTITLASGEQQTSCKVKDEETIVNPTGGGAGTDEFTELALSGCTSKPSPCPTRTKEEVIALNLPWKTHLIAGPPIRDVIEGVDLQVRCSGTVIETLTGTLEPEVGKSVLEFGKGSGSLTTETKATATVGGNDKLTGPKGDEEITAH